MLSAETRRRHGLDADRFERIGRQALEDAVLQLKAKQFLQSSLRTDSKLNAISSIPDDRDPGFCLALLRQSVVELLEEAMPNGVGDRLAQALTQATPSERAHQTRAVLDRLPADIRQCIRSWVSMLAGLQRKQANLLHYPLLCQMGAFVVLSHAYHRSKFISFRQLSDHQTQETVEIGLVLLQSSSFLFADHDLVAGPIAKPNQPDLEDEVRRLQTALESAQVQVQALTGDNDVLRSQLQKSSRSSAGARQQPGDEAAPPPSRYDAVWRPVPARVGRQPAPRFRHTAVFDAGRSALLIYAGLGDDKQLDDLWRLDVDRLVWDRPPMAGRTPPARHGHGAALAAAHHLVVFGGLVGRFHTDETLILNIATWRWSAAPVEGRRPAARDGAVLAPFDDASVLLFGGSDRQQVFHDLWRFSLADRTWTPLAVHGDYPQPRSLAVFGPIADQVWVVSGTDPDDVVAIGEFAPNRDGVVWKRVSGRRQHDGAGTPPLARLGVVLARQPMVVTERAPSFGERLQPGLASFRMGISRFAISSATWDQIDSIGEAVPSARSGASLCAVSESKAILFGGYCSERLFNEIWVLDIESQRQDS